MSNFEARLKEAFDYASMADIARRLEVSHPTIQNYFKGRLPAPDVLIKIADETNVSLNWLLTGQGDKTITPKIPTFDKLFEEKIREIVRQELKTQRGAKTFTIGDEKEEQEKRAA